MNHKNLKFVRDRLAWRGCFCHIADYNLGFVSFARRLFGLAVFKWDAPRYLHEMTSFLFNHHNSISPHFRNSCHRLPKYRVRLLFSEVKTCMLLYVAAPYSPRSGQNWQNTLYSRVGKYSSLHIIYSRTFNSLNRLEPGIFCLRNQDVSEKFSPSIDHFLSDLDLQIYIALVTDYTVYCCHKEICSLLTGWSVPLHL